MLGSVPDSIERFYIAAQYSADDPDVVVQSMGIGDGQPFLDFAPEIILWPPYGVFGVGTELPFPDQRTLNPCEGCGAPIFFQPNLQFNSIPEPSTWMLLVPGLFLLFWRGTRLALA